VKVANIGHRAHLVEGGLCFDIAPASDGRFPADPQAVFARWQEISDWAAGNNPGNGRPNQASELLPPVPRPRPRPIFAVGLNYLAHAAEARVDPPREPMVFTKFVTSLTPPGRN